MVGRSQARSRQGKSGLQQSVDIGQLTSEDGLSNPTMVDSPPTFEQVPVNEIGAHTSVKRGRGKTRGIAFAKKRRAGEKLSVDIPLYLWRAVGTNSQELITESGIIVRQMASLQYVKWKDIPEDDKRKMWQSLRQKFTLNEEPHVQKAVYRQLNTQYRSYRYRLHKQHYLAYENDEVRLQNCPSGVSQSDWEHLVKHFGSEEFKKVSERNKQNREKQKIGHIAGTKGFARTSYDNRNKVTGEEPTRTSLWYLTRFSEKKKKWVDETSQQVYEKLTSLETQPVEDGVSPMTEDERFVQVLGLERSGQIRGRGAGPKLSSSAASQRNCHAQLQKENEEFRRQAEEDRGRLVLLEKENNDMASRVEYLASQLASQAAIHSQFASMLEQFRQSGQIHVPLSNRAGVAES